MDNTHEFIVPPPATATDKSREYVLAPTLVPVESIEIEATEASEVQQQSKLRKAAGAAIVLAAGFSLIFEQSPANEMLRTNIGLDVLADTQSAVAVGVAIAGITSAIEFTSATLISLGLQAESGAVQKLKNRMSKKSMKKLDDALDTPEKTAASKVGNVMADAGISLGIGAGLVTVKRHVALAPSEHRTLGQDLVTSAKATGVVASVSGGIGYLAGGGMQHAEGTFMEYPAELFVDYGTDTKFWISALVLGYGAYGLKKAITKIRNGRDSDDENETIAPPPQTLSLFNRPLPNNIT